MKECAGLTLTHKALDDAARASYERRMKTGPRIPRMGIRPATWEELPPEMRDEEKEAVLAAIYSAVVSSNEVVRNIKIKNAGAASTAAEVNEKAKCNDPHSLEFHSSGMTPENFIRSIFQGSRTDTPENHDHDDIIEYIAHRVSVGVPKEETYQKVSSFISHLLSIATIKLKGKDNAIEENSKEKAVA